MFTGFSKDKGKTTPFSKEIASAVPSQVKVPGGLAEWGLVLQKEPLKVLKPEYPC